MKQYYHHQSKDFNGTNTKMKSDTIWDGNGKNFFGKILSSHLNSLSLSLYLSVYVIIVSVAVGAQPASVNLKSIGLLAAANSCCWIAGNHAPCCTCCHTHCCSADHLRTEAHCWHGTHTWYTHAEWQTVGNKILYYHQIPLSEKHLFVIVCDDTVPSYHSLRCGCFYQL